MTTEILIEAENPRINQPVNRRYVDGYCPPFRVTHGLHSGIFDAATFKDLQMFGAAVGVDMDVAATEGEYYNGRDYHTRHFTAKVGQGQVLVFYQGDKDKLELLLGAPEVVEVEPWCGITAGAGEL